MTIYEEKKIGHFWRSAHLFPSSLLLLPWRVRPSAHKSRRSFQRKLEKMCGWCIHNYVFVIVIGLFFFCHFFLLITDWLFSLLFSFLPFFFIDNWYLTLYKSNKIWLRKVKRNYARLDSTFTTLKTWCNSLKKRNQRYCSNAYCGFRWLMNRSRSLSGGLRLRITCSTSVFTWSPVNMYLDGR